MNKKERAKHIAKGRKALKHQQMGATMKLPKLSRPEYIGSHGLVVYLRSPRGMVSLDNPKIGYRY